MWSDDGRLGEGVPVTTTTTFTSNDTLDAVGDMSVEPLVPATLVAPATGSNHQDAPVLQWASHCQRNLLLGLPVPRIRS